MTDTRIARSGTVKVAYEVHEQAGPDAPWAVLVHGLGYPRRGWEPVIDPLAHGLRLVVLDNRGIGDSDAPPGPYSAAEMAEDVVAVLDDAGLARAAVVGSSLGGMIAMELAINHPVRVDRLVLVSTTPGGEQAAPMPVRTRRLLARAQELEPAAALEALIANALSSRARERDPSLVRRIFEIRTSPPQDPQGWRAQAAAGTTYDAGGRQRQIAAPTLVVQGTDDAVVDPRNATLLGETIPDSRVEWFEGAGHLPFWEEPDRFADRVIAFLTEESAR